MGYSLSTPGRRSIAIGAASLAVLGAVGCGSNDDKSSSSGGTATAASTAKLTGTPVKLGQIVSTDGAFAYPEIKAAAVAAVDGVNRRGGIAGHPVELMSCNDSSDPNKGVACARKLVAAGVVAEVGGLDFVAEAKIGPILEAAGIPQVGDSPQSGGWAAQDNTFLLYNSEQDTFAAAAPKFCLDSGSKKVADLQAPYPVVKAINKTFVKAARSAGATVVATPTVSVTSADVAPIARTLQSAGASCVYPIVPPPQLLSIMKTGTTLGLKAQYLIPTGTVGPKELKSFGSLANGQLVLSGYPVPTDTENFPVLKEFQDDLKRTGGPADEPNLRGTALNAWFGVRAIAKVMEGSTGAVTKESLMAKLKVAKDVDLGLPIKWSPNSPAPAGEAWKRVWNGNVYAHPIKDGKVTPGGDPVDSFQFLQG
jgi:ABC-type branched-subunit amino acid transport system substrate-binding protein